MNGTRFASIVRACRRRLPSDSSTCRAARRSGQHSTRVGVLCALHARAKKKITCMLPRSGFFALVFQNWWQNMGRSPLKNASGHWNMYHGRGNTPGRGSTRQIHDSTLRRVNTPRAMFPRRGRVCTRRERVCTSRRVYTHRIHDSTLERFFADRARVLTARRANTGESMIL